MEFEYQGLTDRGIDWGRSLQAAVYPSRRPYDGEKGTGKCKEFPETVKARELGLPPMGAVCLVCRSREGCDTWPSWNAPGSPRHGIMTSQRAALTDLGMETEAKDAVFLVNGRALDVLVPTLDVALDEDHARIYLSPDRRGRPGVPGEMRSARRPRRRGSGRPAYSSTSWLVGPTRSGRPSRPGLAGHCRSLPAIPSRTHGQRA